MLPRPLLLAGRVARNGSREGQGVVLAEAQAAGLPTVSCRVGGIPESVAPAWQAYLTPPDDPVRLADRLAECLADAASWPARAAAARRFVREHFDAPELARRLAEIYREAVDEPPACGVTR